MCVGGLGTNGNSVVFCFLLLLITLYAFFFDNFVAYLATPSVLQEEGNRLSPPGFPLGPEYVNY